MDQQQRSTGRLPLIAFFALLGCIYLLPFNTLINLYDYYHSVIFHKTNITASSYLLVSNGLFQAGGLIVNTGAIFLSHLSHNTMILTHIFAVVISCFLLLELGLFGFINIVHGTAYYYIACGVSFFLSASQALFDTASLYFGARDGKTLLAYTMGVNISGTLHAIVYVLLLLVPDINLYVVGPVYLFTTAVFVSLAGSSFRVGVYRRAPSAPSTEEPERANKWKLGFYATHVFINFVITLGIYPHLMIRVNHLYFNALVVFLNFNFSALLGNIIAYFKPTVKPVALFIILLLRILVCTTYFIAITPSSTFYKDIGNGIMIALAGATSGYIASCDFLGASMLPSKIFSVRVVNAALGLGLICGNAVSYLILYLTRY